MTIKLKKKTKQEQGTITIKYIYTYYFMYITNIIHEISNILKSKTSFVNK